MLITARKSDNSHRNQGLVLYFSVLISCAQTVPIYGLVAFLKAEVTLRNLPDIKQHKPMLPPLILG
jgi:hypothetical protein